MTYNEWRDELKNNLLIVSEEERKRVLDYYAEAYADRRDAGFSETEIIAGFGAPYDAAKRILAEEPTPLEEHSAASAPAKPPETAKKSGKTVALCVLLVLIALFCVSWACDSVVEAISAIRCCAASFFAGEALTGMAVLGTVFMFTGCAVIAVSLVILCVKKIGKCVKELNGGNA